MNATLLVARVLLLIRRDAERGASLVEYALLIALIAVVCIVGVTFLGTQASESYSRSTSSMFLGN